MTDQQTKYNPELADLLNKLKQDIFYSLNVCQIGTIESYLPATNTAAISINFKRKLPTGKEISYPLLMDCPVFILSGGDCSIDIPITKGDECIILFNDRCIDDWYYSGEVKAPAAARSHDLSDAIALVGVRNLKKAKPTSLVSLRINSGAKKVAIKNDVTSLKTVLDQLITALTSLTVIPSTGVISPPTIAALTSVQAQIATLLDEGIL